VPVSFRDDATLLAIKAQAGVRPDKAGTSGAGQDVDSNVYYTLNPPGQKQLVLAANPWAADGAGALCLHLIWYILSHQQRKSGPTRVRMN